jgi:prepilin signal peptidase PulO-like enzyme (type II secretory pathway)
VQHAFINYCGYRLPYHLTRGAIGYGDVRLASLIGLYSGSFFNSTYYLLFVNLLSLIIAGCCAITLLIIDRRGLRERIPFAPFMFLGLISALILFD